jgi:glycosyltransferase involved in cell wall biosynthesis
LLARIFRKRTILNYHDGRAEDHLEHWPIARRLMRLATTIVVPSDYLVDVFARFGLYATRIYNVAETQPHSFRDRKRPRPVFLHNRGLAAEYNPACTLRAFAIIQRLYPEASLTIAHDGPLRPALETLATSLGLRQTQFIGPVSAERMGALYDSADIYLMSPNADNMPLSALECFAAGLPIVSSNAGGIPNIVEDQINGLLFAPGDHQAMAKCAFRLLEEPGLASRLAANARVQCIKYSWPVIGPQWIELYRHLLDRSINSV